MEKNNVSAIYNATINSVLSDVTESEIELIKKAYCDYVNDSYGYLDIAEHIVNIYIKEENEKWAGMSTEDKKAYLIEDEMFLE